jgi:hypothetical protein
MLILIDLKHQHPQQIINSITVGFLQNQNQKLVNLFQI